MLQRRSGPDWKKDIYGVELEREHAERCRENLDREAGRFGILGVKWNIICGNYLQIQLNREFSYVLGEPALYRIPRYREERKRVSPESFRELRGG